MIRAIFSVLILLTSLLAVAQNNASIVLSTTFILFDENGGCLISGEGIECVRPGVVRVPMGLTATCDVTNVHREGIEVQESGQYLVFTVGETTVIPRVEAEIEYEKVLEFSDTSFIIVWTDSAGPHLLVSGAVSGCAIPSIHQGQNFSAAGKEWQVNPEFSSTATSVTLESLIFERQ